MSDGTRPLSPEAMRLVKNQLSHRWTIGRDEAYRQLIEDIAREAEAEPGDTESLFEQTITLLGETAEDVLLVNPETTAGRIIRRLLLRQLARLGD